MKSSAGMRRLEGMRALLARKPRSHTIWCWHDEIDTVFEAEKRAMIESGRASEKDEFIPFTWVRPAGDPPSNPADRRQR